MAGMAGVASLSESRLTYNWQGRCILAGKVYFGPFTYSDAMIQRLAVPISQVLRRRLNEKWESVIGPVVNGTVAESARMVVLKSCGQSFWQHRCGNGHSIHVRQGCKEVLCYPCSTGYSKRLTDDLMGVLDIIYQSLHDHIGYSGFEFTLPIDIQEKVTESDLKQLRDWVIEILTEYYAGEKLRYDNRHARKRFAIGGMVAVQWWHSYRSVENGGLKGNVWRGWYPHVHATVYDRMWDNKACLFGEDGMRRTDGAFVKRRLSLSVAEVNALRITLAKKWKAKVEAKFGKSTFQAVGVGPKGYDQSWDVHYEYGVARVDAERRAAYMIRSVVQDSYREVVHNNSLPTEQQKGWAARMLTRQKHKKSYVAFGWMADSVVNKYASSLVVVCPNLVCGHKSHGKRCSVELQFGPCLCKGTKIIPLKKERDRERRKIYCHSLMKDRFGEEVVCGLLMERFGGTVSHEEVVERRGEVLCNSYGRGVNGRFR